LYYSKRLVLPPQKDREKSWKKRREGGEGRMRGKEKRGEGWRDEGEKKKKIKGRYLDTRCVWDCALARNRK
jgi:hypothetical protein